MPDGLLEIVALLVLGYVLLILEIFVPGGVLGGLGLVAMGYGCYLAFGLSNAWGLGAVGLSVLVTVVGFRLFRRTRTAKRLILSDQRGRDWKAAQTGLAELVGRRGTTMTPLRPAGLAEIGELRVDVVSDGQFLPAGATVEVVEIEGNRVVVEAVAEAAEPAPVADREAPPA